MYVIVTSDFVFHIGKVECVTCHIPFSHAIDGEVKEEGWDAVLKVGGRRRTIDVAVIAVVVKSCTCAAVRRPLIKGNGTAQ